MRLGGTLVMALAVLMGALGGISAAAQDTAGYLGPGVVNLGHLDFLHDSVPYPVRPPVGHWTTDPGSPIDTWWVYADFNPTRSSYTRTGGGSYDPGTNTYGQGAFDTDDVSRAAVAYLTHYRYYHDLHSLKLARSALALYKSLTDKGAEATLPNVGRWEVRLYDRNGRLIATVGRRGGEAVTLPAYGSAMAAGG